MPETKRPSSGGENGDCSGDPVAAGREFLLGVLERMGIDAEIGVQEVEDRVVLEIQCEDAERVIGRRGQVIDALQHLVGKVASAKRSSTEPSKPLVVDAGGYRGRHIEHLQALAEKMCERATASGREVRLSPMPARDRRVVHMAIAERPGVTTRSDGEGDDRHVVVVPVRGDGEAQGRRADEAAGDS